MITRCLLLLSGLALAECLVACDSTMSVENEGPVRVSFAQPFPAGVPDLTGFLPRDHMQRLVADDTTKQLGISQTALYVQRSATMWLPTKEVDSLRLSKQLGARRAYGGEVFQVRALTADSVLLRVEASDTLLHTSGKRRLRLRYYGGWYYLSTPSPADSTKWQVERLAITSRQLTWQLLNADSLRLRALDPASLQVRRAAGVLYFTLVPPRGRATRQLSSYGGLWLPRPDRSFTLLETASKRK